MNIFVGILKRVVRGAVAIAVPIAINYVNNSTDPTTLLIAPVLMGLGKGLRDKYKGAWWLPV